MRLLGRIRRRRHGDNTSSNERGKANMKVLITGGSRGIGRAIAEKLARDGHEILLVATNKAALDEARNSISSRTQSKVLSFSADVSQPSAIADLYRFCLDNAFLPNVLVLSAGIFIEGTLTDSKNDDFLRTMEVDCVSAYYLVKQFVDELTRQKAPKIILIGSTAAYEPYPIGPLYGVAKWALRGYAINLRRELMPKGVAVTFLAPGGTLTDLWAGEDLPEKRLLEPSDWGKVVSMILTLSDQAVVEEMIVRPILGDIHE